MSDPKLSTRRRPVKGEFGWLPEPTLHDLADMPDWNPSTGSHALRSVSEGRVYWDHRNKVCCKDHRAMNAVNPDRTIWRCLAFGCQTGAFVSWA